MRPRIVELHGNMWITMCKTDSWWKFAEWCRELRSGALWQPRGVAWVGMGGRLKRGRICVYIDVYTYMAER